MARLPPFREITRGHRIFSLRHSAFKCKKEKTVSAGGAGGGLLLHCGTAVKPQLPARQLQSY